MYTLRRALALGGVIVLATLALALVLTAACGGGGDSSSETPTIIRTTVDSGQHNGSLTLANYQVNLGDVNTVEGENWTGSGPVNVFLLTEQQHRADTNNWSEEAVLLGETTPTEEGSFSFDFRLESSYIAADGSQLGVQAGDKLFIGAAQRTEGGSYRFNTGPMIVNSEEGR